MDEQPTNDNQTEDPLLEKQNSGNEEGKEAVKPDGDDEKSPAEQPVDRTATWQDRLLPIMTGILIGLSIFFFIVTYLQMSSVQKSILQMPDVGIDEGISEKMIASAETFTDKFAARQFEVRSKLEVFIITNRYHQAKVMLMARLWIRYLGFITGMILAVIGASFVLGKLQEPSQELRTELPTGNLTLRTTSPGIILVVLGVVLIVTSTIYKDTIEVQDMGLYLSTTSENSSGSVQFTIPTTLESPSENLIPTHLHPLLTGTPDPLFDLDNP